MKNGGKYLFLAEEVLDPSTALPTYRLLRMTFNKENTSSWWKRFSSICILAPCFSCLTLANQTDNSYDCGTDQCENGKHTNEAAYSRYNVRKFHISGTGQSLADLDRERYDKDQREYINPGDNQNVIRF